MLRRPSSPPSQARLTEHARSMLASPTASEEHLWKLGLSARKLGVTFRRQVPLGGRYIADFYCASERLVVELDGGHHQGRAEADARRDRAFRKLGYRVVRLEVELVLRDLPRAVELVREAIAGGKG